jgi:hypothetical protein
MIACEFELDEIARQFDEILARLPDNQRRLPAQEEQASERSTAASTDRMTKNP